MSKQKTNDQMLLELIKSNTPIQNAMLRERIVAIMDLTIGSIKSEPEKWENGFINSELYLELGRRVDNVIGFR